MMDVLITFLTLANLMLAVLLVVVSMARLDRTYTAKVRAENARKSILRGQNHDRL